MNPRSTVYLVVAFALAFSLFTQGLSGASAMHPAKHPVLKGTIKIGQITSTTGAFSVYGAMEVRSFALGIKYATGGTMKVDKAKIVIQTANDATGAGNLPDPATATSDAKSLIQNDHVTFLQCCASSASALAVAGVAKQYKKILMVAPAATNALAGVNRYTFRTSREDSQDAITGAGYAVKKFGKNYMTLAQDYAFGHDQVNTWKTHLTKLKAKDLGDVFFPLTTTDFTPYLTQILAKHPKWLFIPCAGAQCLTLWKQLAQQGVTSKTHIMTGLPNIAAIPFFGSAGPKMGFISVYYYKFAHTKANTYLVNQLKKKGITADIFDQDSFAAGQQLVAALKKTHSTNTNTIMRALEGQTVQGPKGAYTIRKQDHVCLQPMYIASLQLQGGKLVPHLLQVKSPKSVAPGLQAHFTK